MYKNFIIKVKFISSHVLAMILFRQSHLLHKTLKLDYFILFG